ncbi:Gfo/Idh/MocA family oxidoreductase [Streptomyces pactum]|uniref:Gfo/Idh/MocA family oxidoreductase n=1 Tax=Streptomyces pactum TaxID=68249 RepID=A0ABS0NIA3_9ACTN|nr:Gfo/Idh/MocA family oxidoreductase [Streptomyces pactum]MBH5334934.1 Gfo/Idh/MocA family oxidoreductase [Streptomyces pactum]
MLHTLLVGLGRSGRELHLPVLRRLRLEDTAGAGALFASDAPLGYDIARPAAGAAPGPVTVASPEDARERLDPGATVVHVCTPPTARAQVVTEFAELGFRNFLVEKPIGTGTAAVEALRQVRDRYRLRLAVVAPWLHSTLTARLERLVTTGDLGALRRITVHQRKPRLRRSLADTGHPSAFDVEMPHSVGVALRLAGAGRVHRAHWTDARAGTAVAPRMGTAELTIRHERGTVSRIATDLVSPVRERSIVLDFEAGTVVGHYPVGGEDPYAQLRITPDAGPEEHDIFLDEALDACLLQVYRDFAGGAGFTADFELQARVVEVLEAAKHRAAAGDGGPVRPPGEPAHGEPAVGVPGSGEPVTGGPGTGALTAGEPGAGAGGFVPGRLGPDEFTAGPVTGEPVPCDVGPGDPGAGDPGAGDPAVVGGPAVVAAGTREEHRHVA